MSKETSDYKLYKDHNGKWCRDGRELTCRDCRYYTSEADSYSGNSLCKYHQVRFDGNYKQCEDFEYNSSSNSDGCGCLLWIIGIIFIAHMIYTLFFG